MSKVTVTVTSRKAGTWTIAPYNPQQGLRAAPGTTYELPVYEVPIYEVTVGTELPLAVFKAVRFGLVRDNKTPPPAERRCDNGLAAAQVLKPSWVPDYGPHSFGGTNRRGAWRLIHDGGWLIHEGTAAPYDGASVNEIGGSLGCIEVVGPLQWNAFMDAVELRAGAPAATIGARQDLTVVIEHAERPEARLLFTVTDVRT